MAALPAYAKSVLYDAVVLPSGAAAVRSLLSDGRTLEFVKDQYRHCKPILALGDGVGLLEACGIPLTLTTGEPDPGLIVATNDDDDPADAFITALAKHGHLARETDPPRV